MKKIAILTACYLVYLTMSSAFANPNANQKWEWDCPSVKIKTTNLFKDKVIWKNMQCNGKSALKKLDNLNINVIYVPIHDPEVKFIPYQAQTSNQLATLPQIADSLNANPPAKYRGFEVIAGINGGYFYRNDVEKFKDNICTNKTKNPPLPGESMGDSLLQYEGANYATNCAYVKGIFKNPRAALVLTGESSEINKKAPYITLVDPYITYMQNKEIPDALGAGPNLVTDGKLTVNNPDENLVPTFEFAANSAVGIINDINGPAQLVLFTVDGNNKSFQNKWPAMNAYQMGDFMLNYLHVANAISMDQGGSTTLYVGSKDLDRTVYPLGVVSNSKYEPNTPRSADNVRSIYDGLFILIPKDANSK